MGTSVDIEIPFLDRIYRIDRIRKFMAEDFIVIAG